MGEFDVGHLQLPSGTLWLPSTIGPSTARVGSTGFYGVMDQILGSRKHRRIRRRSGSSVFPPPLTPSLLLLYIHISLISGLFTAMGLERSALVSIWYFLLQRVSLRISSWIADSVISGIWKRIPPILFSLVTRLLTSFFWRGLQLGDEIADKIGCDGDKPPSAAVLLQQQPSQYLGIPPKSSPRCLIKFLFF